MMEGAPVADGARGAPVGAPHPAVEISPRARFEVLGAILLALLLGALDQTIVGTALPRIVTDLHGDNLYTLTSADRPYRVLVEEMGEGAVTISEQVAELAAKEPVGT